MKKLIDLLPVITSTVIFTAAFIMRSNFLILIGINWILFLEIRRAQDLVNTQLEMMKEGWELYRAFNKHQSAAPDDTPPPPTPLKDIKY